MGERAARWFRASTDKQDEANQVREVDGHCAGHGYDVARTFRLHDVSASKGEQEAALEQALADIRAGEYSVIVIAHSSRLDRRDVDTQQLYAIRVRMAGGRIESAREPQFGAADIAGRVVTLLAQDANHQYVRTLTEHVLAAFEVIDANGAWRGKPPWGFVTAGTRRDKHLVPTAQARAYIPEVFRRVTGGQSLAQVCRWLEAESVAPAGVAKTEDEDGNPVTRGKSGQWWPKSLGEIIRNPAYAGRAVVRQSAQDEGGRYIPAVEHVWAGEDCPALVSWSVRAQAIKALEDRPKRGPVVKENRCELSGASRCLSCGGPLYKLVTGAKGRTRTPYLRCAGTGAARKSCGAAMVRLETAQALAEQVLGGLHHPVEQVTLLPGNGPEIEARLAALDYARRQLALLGLSWDEEDAERDRIKAEYSAVQATVRTPDRRVIRGTGESYGQRWARLGTDERAAWLRSGEVTVFFTRGEVPAGMIAAGQLDGVSLVLSWHEDPDIG